MKAGTRASWGLLLVLTLCYVMSLVDRYIFSYLLVAIRQDLGLSDMTLGLVQGFAFTAFYAAVGLPMGLAVDRMHRTRLVAIAVTIWSAMTIACGAARGTLSLTLTRMGVGVGESVLSPATYSILPDRFARRQLPMAMAIYGLGPVIASAAAATLAGWTLGIADSAGQIPVPYLGRTQAWRLAFILAGGPGLLVALLPLFFSDRAGKPEGAVRSTEESNLLAFMMANWRVHGLFGLSIAVTTLMTYAINGWAPSILSRTYHWNPAAISRALGSLTAMGGLLGCVCAGVLTTGFIRAGRQSATPWIAAGAALAFFPAAALPLAQTGEGALALLTPTFIASPLLMVLGPTILQLITPAHLRGRMSAAFLLLNVGLGAGAGPALVGSVSQCFLGSEGANLGLSLALVLIPSASVAVLILGSLIRPLRRSDWLGNLD